jgi:hypothetical protein
MAKKKVGIYYDRSVPFNFLIFLFFNMFTQGGSGSSPVHYGWEGIQLMAEISLKKL